MGFWASSEESRGTPRASSRVRVRVVAVSFVSALVLIGVGAAWATMGTSGGADQSSSNNHQNHLEGTVGSADCSGPGVIGSTTAASTPPAPTPGAVVTWHSITIALTHVGSYSWRSTAAQAPANTQPLTWTTNFKVVNGTATIADLKSQPVMASIPGSPTKDGVQVSVTFDVTCTSGSPSLLLWDIRGTTTPDANGTL